MSPWKLWFNTCLTLLLGSGDRNVSSGSKFGGMSNECDFIGARAGPWTSCHFEAESKDACVASSLSCFNIVPEVGHLVTDPDAEEDVSSMWMSV